MSLPQTFRQLGTALGVSSSKAHTLARDLGLVKGPDGWDVEAFRRAMTPAAAPAAPVERAAPAAAVDRDVKPEKDVDPLAIAREAVLRAKTLLDQADAFGAPRALETLKKVLEELRRTQAGELELEERKGELVSVDDVRAVAAKIGRKFVEGLERLEGRLAPQVELWLADPSFRALEPAERMRSIRKWAAGQTSVAREITAEEVSALLAAEAA